MPYITQERRDNFDSISTPGELNYAFTMVALEYLRMHGKSYDTLNAITGALENCKLEFYRRVVIPYEEEKIKLNGDVY